MGTRDAVCPINWGAQYHTQTGDRKCHTHRQRNLEWIEGRDFVAAADIFASRA